MTPAVKLLQHNNVAHRVLTYDHDPAGGSYGIEAVEALGVAADRVFKTLVAVVDQARHVVGVVPVSSRLDLKAIAAAAGGKKAAMAERAEAERLTGYVLGGISPLGQRRQLATFVDHSARAAPVMYVSGGRRGLEIELTPDDLVATVRGRFAPIATS
jgi:Cys-tRNA(Pro)/Cys-tRNA(Cys) deacylase